MVGHHIDSNSPLLPLAEAEVEVLLGRALRMIGTREVGYFNGKLCELKVGLIAAIDDELEEPKFAGFIQYKPRLFVEGMATIGYAAVVKNYRGQGLFARMLDELKKKYPVLGLDCPLELVPMYEKLGFKVANIQGVHVGMNLGVLGGMIWGQDQESLEKEKIYQHAKEAVRDKLGKNTRNAYSQRDADTQRRQGEVMALLALHGIK